MDRCVADMPIETEVGSVGRGGADGTSSSMDAADGTTEPVVENAGSGNEAGGPNNEAGGPDNAVDPDGRQGTDAALDMDAATLDGSDEAGPEADRDADENVIEDVGPRDADVPVEASVPLCGAEDVSAWRAFMMSGRNVLATSDCYYADPLCAVSACALDVCLRKSAGVTGCASCVAAELACLALNCQAECGTMQIDDACRKCACQRGCMTVTGSCGASDVPVCADCLGPKCTDLVVNPGLIMNLVNYELIVSPF